METTIQHLSKTELEAGLDHIRQSPKDGGELKMIVRRPAVGEREVVAVAELSTEVGLFGDSWQDRPSRHMQYLAPNPEAQITLMNSRVIGLIAQSEERWSLAGDQLYVEMDLSMENLPPGAQLFIGSAVIEISAQPHTGCAKFSARFGVKAHKFVNSVEGKPLRLRGVNARVIQGGEIRVGDVVIVRK